MLRPKTGWQRTSGAIPTSSTMTQAMTPNKPHSGRVGLSLLCSSAVTPRSCPGIETESPVDALPEFVQQHGIDEIVVATMGAHAGSVWDLLECRTRGVKVIDFLSFWERETGRINLDAIEPNWLVYSGGFRSNL